MKRFVILGFVLIFLGFLGGWMMKNKNNILNPIANKKILRQTSSTNSERAQDELVTFGFLPTWMVGKTRIYGKELSHLIFLGIETDEKGNLIWDVQSKKINNEEYINQKKIIKENEGKNILGIKLFDDEKLNILLANKDSVVNLVKQIKKVVLEENFEGINLDFEFQNDPLTILNDDFGFFLKELRLEEVGEISVDVFANTIIKGNKGKLINLIDKLDYLVVMAYDFNRPGVNYAGPVAPISSLPGERNINEVIEKIILGELNKKKIIMAYPLYGYEWKTETNEFGSKVIRGWYQMISWKNAKELLDGQTDRSDFTLNFDKLSMTPWMMFEEDGVIHQIYFENERSLKAKLDLVKQNQLKGYGFWALGYEGEDNLIWSF